MRAHPMVNQLPPSREPHLTLAPLSTSLWRRDGGEVNLLPEGREFLMPTLDAGEMTTELYHSWQVASLRHNEWFESSDVAEANQKAKTAYTVLSACLNSLAPLDVSNIKTVDTRVQVNAPKLQAEIAQAHTENIYAPAQMPSEEITVAINNWIGQIPESPYNRKGEEEPIEEISMEEILTWNIIRHQQEQLIQVRTWMLAATAIWAATQPAIRARGAVRTRGTLGAPSIDVNVIAEDEQTQTARFLVPETPEIDESGTFRLRLEVPDEVYKTYAGKSLALALDLREGEGKPVVIGTYPILEQVIDIREDLSQLDVKETPIPLSSVVACIDLRG